MNESYFYCYPIKNHQHKTKQEVLKILIFFGTLAPSSLSSPRNSRETRFLNRPGLQLLREIDQAAYIVLTIQSCWDPRDSTVSIRVVYNYNYIYGTPRHIWHQNMKTCFYLQVHNVNPTEMGLHGGYHIYMHYMLHVWKRYDSEYEYFFLFTCMTLPERDWLEIGKTTPRLCS